MQLSYERCIRSNDEIAGDAYFSIEAGGAVSRDMVQDDDRDMLDYPEAMRVFIGQLLKLSWQDKPSFTVNGQIMMQAEELLLKYLYHILGKPMKSLKFIQQIG